MKSLSLKLISACLFLSCFLIGCGGGGGSGSSSSTSSGATTGQFQTPPASAVVVSPTN